VNADRSGSGLGVVEGHGAELVIGMKDEVGSEGTSEVKAKGLGGPTIVVCIPGSTHSTVWYM
jgi:hypothetical protein